MPLPSPPGPRPPLTLALSGDVMTGRGIDQILAHPSKPHLHEAYMHSALGYIELAEETTGPIDRPAGFSYIWGDSLRELERLSPDARIINLETAVTTSEDAWPDKGIHYRMHPANVPALLAAGIDCCVLANNHVLDWGHAGLVETLDVLQKAGIRTVGAGRDEAEASAPAILEMSGGRRVLVFAFGTPSSGVLPSWAAGERSPGVSYLGELSSASADAIARRTSALRRPGDVVVLSIHWGDNWGYDISRAERGFVHRLIDEGAADVIHGHSSHHPRGIEVYRGKLVLYGCGDLLNDYEGIRGHERYRPELCLFYLPTIEPGSSRLVALTLIPLRIRHFRVDRARDDEVRWLEETLSREGKRLGTRVERRPDGALALTWAGGR